MLEISAVSSRQYEHRARRRLGAPAGRTPDRPADHDQTADRDHGLRDRSAATVRELLTGFLAAARDGDTEKLIKLLHAEVVYYSDGGGRVKAARKPVVGPTKIAQFATRISRRSPTPTPYWILVNGRTGVLIELGGTRHVITADVEDGMIKSLYDISNPDKLAPVGV